MHLETITFGSVCSGLEAASVAWHRLGWRAAWLAEIEPFPAALLAHHYPTVPNYGDMTKLPAMVRAGLAAAPSVLVGGTPCQAFSFAGLRKSLDDARGQLSLCYVDLANAIDESRIAAGLEPCVTCWENVPGVLSTKDNAFGCFLGALAGEDGPLEPPRAKNGKLERWPDAGCVFGPQRTIAWRVIDAQYVHLAQRRRRVFVVSSAREGFDPAELLFEFDGVRRDTAPSRSAQQGTAAGAAAGAGRCCVSGVDLRNGCLTGDVAHTLQAAQKPPAPGFTPHLLACAFEPRYYTRDNKTGGAPGETVQLSATNAAKVGDAAPCVAYGFQPRIARNGRGDMGDVVSALNAQSGETGKGDAAPCVALAFAENSRAEVRLESGDGSICGAMSTGGGKPGQGTPTVALGFPANLSGTQYASAEDVSPALGAQNPTAVCAPLCFSSKDYGGDVAEDIAPTLRAGGHSTSHANAGIPPAVCFKASHFTRGKDGAPSDLVPPLSAEADKGDQDPLVLALQDCSGRDKAQNGKGWNDEGVAYTVDTHALQGVAVGLPSYTWQVRRLTPTECERLQGFPDGYTLVPHRGKPAADGPRYKALGNSMAVPVMHWIGSRINHFVFSDHAS